jgi:hypothetical protein
MIGPSTNGFVWLAEGGRGAERAAECGEAEIPGGREDGRDKGEAGGAVEGD